MLAETEVILGECKALVRRAFPNSRATAQRDAALYLAHTDRGQTIRALASAIGTHPSTVLRTVRRVEDRRDDPLLDSVLSGLESKLPGSPAAQPPLEAKAVQPGPAPAGLPLDDDAVKREAKRFLRRLNEPGSVLVIAPGTAKGGIFCSANQHRKPIAMVPVALAAEFLRREWIRVASRGSATMRYRITDVGRSFLRRVLAEEASAARGPGRPANASPFAAQHHLAGTRSMVDPATGRSETLPVNLGETPLGWLARRKGPDGKPFLGADEVEAGERLRVDFELAQIGPQVAQDWRKFLTPGDRLSGSPRPSGPAEGPMAARDRVAKALAALGPDLSDIALRTCCFLEGLEASERRFGWSARSGKVVLKIALQRLSEHYGLTAFKK